MDLHLERIVEIIENSIAEFKTLLPKCKIEISCGFSSGNGQGGFVINADLMRKLIIIPADIVMDLYPPESGVEMASPFDK